jgi:hypothetical protein
LRLRVGFPESDMKILTATLAFVLAAGPVLADTAPLAAGKPAGVQKAQLDDGNTMLFIGAGALVAIGIVLATQGNGSGPTSQVNTVTGTNP